jgi:hypothetical protein
MRAVAKRVVDPLIKLGLVCGHDMNKVLDFQVSLSPPLLCVWIHGCVMVIDMDTRSFNFFERETDPIKNRGYLLFILFS